MGKSAEEILRNLATPLADAVIRTFNCDDQSETNVYNSFATLVADYSRPQLFLVSGAAQLHASLCRILADKDGPVGVACSAEGHLAVAQASEVYLFQLTSLSGEEIALVLFALSAWGVSVAHGSEDLAQFRDFLPQDKHADFSNLVSRIRQVLSPSEITFVATEPWNALADRAVLAKSDALLPAPSHSPSPQPSPSSTPPFR